MTGMNEPATIIVSERSYEVVIPAQQIVRGHNTIEVDMPKSAYAAVRSAFEERRECRIQFAGMERACFCDSVVYDIGVVPLRASWVVVGWNDLASQREEGT